MNTSVKIILGLVAVTAVGITIYLVAKPKTPAVVHSTEVDTQTTNTSNGMLGFLKGVLPEGMKVSLA